MSDLASELAKRITDEQLERLHEQILASLRNGAKVTLSTNPIWVHIPQVFPPLAP